MLHFRLECPKKCLYLHRKNRLFIMRRKSILLDSDSINQLMSEGRCEVKRGMRVTIDTIYKVSNLSDCCVRVVKASLDSVTFELVGSVVGASEHREFRMVKLEAFKSEGAFIDSRSKYSLGEVVVVAESYNSIFEHIDSEDGKVEFLHRVAETHKTEVKDVRSISGWYNANKVLPELMSKKVQIVDIEKVRVRSLTDADWELIGVVWFSEHYKVLKRKAYVGSVVWNLDKEVVFYRYKVYERE